MSSVPSPPEQPQGPARILLVDDEPMILQALQRELRSAHYAVVAYTDPRAARECLAEQPVDLVVSDNMMPGLTGLELASWIQRHHPDVRRILLTGRTDLNDAIKAFNAGTIHRFFQKPWRKPELAKAIEEELGHAQALHAERQQREALETAAKRRASQLLEAREELKEVRTQLFLHEDGTGAALEQLSPAIRQLRYLIVEEHEGIRDLLATTLRKAGVAHVDGVPDAQQALEFLRTTPQVDVVLSEWKLRDMDGLELYRTLRESKLPTANALFLLVTTREHRVLVEHALKAGVDGYVLKPFRLSSLVGQIEKHLARRPRDPLQRQIQELRACNFVVANSDLESRFQIQELLVSNGLENVALADSGGKALRTVQQRPVHVLIYDCNVRDPYWPELGAHMEALGIAQPPALLVTSVTPTPGEVEDARRRGLATFLPGPFQRGELFQAIVSAWQAHAGKGTRPPQDRS